MLELKQVRKKYPLQKAPALDGVDLRLSPGEIVGLFGENGAGKTTLMKSILNFHSFQGNITLDGERISHHNIPRLSFATCEHSFFSEINGKAHREFYQRHFPNFRGKRFDSLMDFFELPTNQQIRRFSTGQKNQFEVILALCQGAEDILMDEPFAGNDIFNREDFYKVLLGILEENETILLSTHLIEEVEQFISRAVLLSKGKVVGDCSMEDLESQNLTSYVKEVYHYEKDRVSRALESFQEEKEGE